MSVVVRNANLRTLYAVPSNTALKIAKEIPFNEWRDLLDTVALMGEHVAWWVGDALAFGDEFKASYREAIDQVNGKFGAFQNYAWVARAVAPSTRVENLSWSHHRAVAALKTETEQIRWLDAAERLGWNVHELEEAIRQERAELPRQATLALTVRATGGLYEECTREAERLDVDPVEWGTIGWAWLVANGSPHLAASKAA